MWEDRLQDSLIGSGYRRIDSNAQGIYAYHRATDQELRIISVMRIPKGDELTYEQYIHILEQMKESFRSSYPYRISVLSLILTGNPDSVRRFATEPAEDSHWIIDLRTNRLIIYEMQTSGFSDLQRTIEQLLTEENNNQYSEHTYDQTINPQSGFGRDNNQGNYPQGTSPARNLNYRYLLTPVTMGIIALNILVYIITHFTPLFGGPEAMLEKGALSWYYVVENKEYYRILTSIFLHADWSHLVNNMIVLLFVGGNLEKVIGRWRYLFIYFAGGILAGLTSIGYNMWKEYAEVVAYQETTISIGASGAIFTIVGAVLFVVLINKGRLKEISIRQMIFFVILSLYSGIVNSQIDQAAHVGGFLAGVILAVILYRRKTSHEN